MSKIRIICLRKKPWVARAFGLLALVVCLGVAGQQIFQQVVTVTANSRQLPIYSVQTQEKQLSISFDAAWGNEDTQDLIDILAEYEVYATFFVVGEWVDKYPESVLALHEAGHEVMNHSDTHAHYPQLSPQEIIDDLTACNDKIVAVTGVRPSLIRLPYGDYDEQVIATIRAMGMEPIQWDVDSLDWKNLSAEEICSRVTSKVGEGSIVLFHNAALNTPAALPGILQCLQGEGYEFVMISQLLLDCDYGIDHTGRQYQME